MDQVTEHLPPVHTSSEHDGTDDPCAVFATGAHGTWYCTRNIGHADDHEAGTDDGFMGASWPQDGTL